MNNKASVKAQQQRYDTMAEQINIRKAHLTKRLLDRKTEEADLEAELSRYSKILVFIKIPPSCYKALFFIIRYLLSSTCARTLE